MSVDGLTAGAAGSSSDGAAPPAAGATSFGDEPKAKQAHVQPQSYALPLPLAPLSSRGRGDVPPEADDSAGAGPSKSLATAHHVDAPAASECLAKVIAAVCQEQGFEGTTGSALNSFTSLLEQFVERLALITQTSHTLNAGRSRASAHDLIAALADQGITKRELRTCMRRPRRQALVRDVLPALRLQLPEEGTGKARAVEGEAEALPNWADPSAVFLPLDGPLAFTAKRKKRGQGAAELKDVPSLGPIVFQLSDSAYSHLPPLPASYTFLETPAYTVPQGAPPSLVPPHAKVEESTTASASAAVRPLEFVERKWTNSQLTQTTLKSLIRRIEAAQAGLWDAEKEKLVHAQKVKPEPVDAAQEGVGPTEADPGPANKKRRLTLRTSIGGLNRANLPAGDASMADASKTSAPGSGATSPEAANSPRRSFSLNIRRDGNKPSLSVIPPGAPTSSAGASSTNAPAQSPMQSPQVFKSGKLSLRVRTASTSAASPSGDASAARADPADIPPTPTMPKTPLSALYSTGAAKLGLGLGLGLPGAGPMGPSPLSMTPTSAQGPTSDYFSRIHSSMHARRSTFASTFENISRGNLAQFSSAPGSRLPSDTALGVPPTPVTPGWGSPAFVYPGTPVEAHNPMGGSLWRANIFGGSSSIEGGGGSPFSFPPPSPLPADVVSGARSRAASLSIPVAGGADSPAPQPGAAGPSASAATPANAGSGPAVSADTLVESLASLPGVVNFKNTWYRHRNAHPAIKQEHQH